MAGLASNLSRALARNAEAVCRHYLGAGRREGRYWIAGDALGSPGRSLYVRLKGDDHGKGAAGKWTEYVAPEVMLRWEAQDHPALSGAGIAAT